jgi:hypothetical protein
MTFYLYQAAFHRAPHERNRHLYSKLTIALLKLARGR